MKTLVLSFIMIFGLTATNHGHSMLISDGDEVRMSDEAYVDDIPFDTHAIACQALLDRMVMAVDEANVNDIPFDTQRLYNLCRLEKLVQQFRTECNKQDFPYDTRRIANITFFTFRHGILVELPAINVNPALELRDRVTFSSFTL